MLRGLGLAVLSSHTVQKELQAGQLFAVRVAGLPLERDLYVAWDHRRVLPAPAQFFLHALAPGPEDLPPNKQR